MTQHTNKKRGIGYYVRGIKAVLHEYIYRVGMVVSCKMRYLSARARHRGARRYIVCYPQKPMSLHSLYIVSHTLGLKITDTPQENAEAYTHFEDTTFRSAAPLLATIAGEKEIINAQCSNISKAKVEEAFEQAFGYGMKIDPQTHTGKCVQKSNINAQHDGTIVECPREPEDGYIYQKLIDTQDGEMAVDLRISVFRHLLPLVYLRYKHIEDRFDNNIRSVRVPVESVLTPDECNTIRHFCDLIHLDYGELDMLRDKHDGKLYIVDANNTPYGPMTPDHLSNEEYELFVKISSESFREAFLETGEN